MTIDQHVWRPFIYIWTVEIDQHVSRPFIYFSQLFPWPRHPFRFPSPSQFSQCVNSKQSFSDSGPVFHPTNLLGSRGKSHFDSYISLFIFYFASIESLPHLAPNRERIGRKIVIPLQISRSGFLGLGFRHFHERNREKHATSSSVSPFFFSMHLIGI